MSKWISVKEKLPNQYDNVLVFIKGKTLSAEVYRVEDSLMFLIIGFGALTADKVSHWMPLPNPPKAEEKL